MSHRLVVGALVAALSSCGTEEVVAEEDSSNFGELQSELRVPPSAPAVALRVRESASQSPSFATVFPIRSTYSIFFALDLPSNKKGLHKVAFEVYGPSGFLYARYSVLSAVGQSPTAGQVAAEAINGGYRAWSSMPCSGTDIERYGMRGRWMVRAFLDSVQVAGNDFILN